MRVHIIAALAVSFCLATSAGADTNIVFEESPKISPQCEGELGLLVHLTSQRTTQWLPY